MTDNEMSTTISRYFAKHRETIDRVERDNSENIMAVAKMLTKSLVGGNKVLIMGNGGSAADAQHFAAELVGRFLIERKGYPAIALTTDSSILTAVGNDYGFENIFTRQVEALSQPGDVVIGISTSGNSENVFRALQLARQSGCETVCFLGGQGSRMFQVSECSLVVNNAETPFVQEAHATMIHLICKLVEQTLTKADS